MISVPRAASLTGRNFILEVRKLNILWEKHNKNWDDVCWEEGYNVKWSVRQGLPEKMTCKKNLNEVGKSEEKVF